MTQIVAEEQLRLREKLMRKPKPSTANNEKSRTTFDKKNLFLLYNKQQFQKKNQSFR
jgi:hypothetical protein